MSYYTTVRIRYFGEDSVTPEHLLEAAESYLDTECAGYGIDHILADLKRGLEFGGTETSFSDLRSSDLSEIFLALSKRFPALTLRIWGHGEEYSDVWSRGFRAGEVIYQHGPFEV